MAEQEAQKITEKVATVVTVTAMKPQLLIEAPKAREAIEFYKNVFDAVEGTKTLNLKRKAEQDQQLILSGELKLADTTIIIADNIYDPAVAKRVGSGVMLNLETNDIEAIVSKAVAAGAVAEGDITDNEGSGRDWKIKDPFGFLWNICSPAYKSDDVTVPKCRPI